MRHLNVAAMLVAQGEPSAAVHLGHAFDADSSGCVAEAEVMVASGSSDAS